MIISQKVEKKACLFCKACINICPKQAISMYRDEYGFAYPIIDNQKCINCNLCEKICQYINTPKHNDLPRRAFVAQNKNETIRKESTSGGIFSAIAEEIIKNNFSDFAEEFRKNKREIETDSLLTLRVQVLEALLPDF